MNTLRKLIKSILIFLFSFFLVLKMTIILQPTIEPIEFGELQVDSEFSVNCKINYKNLNDLADLVDSGVSPSNAISFLGKENSCGHYWRINGMRGFYIHHYSSLFKEIELTNISFKNFVEILNHQYGMISLIFPFLLANFDIQISMQLFASLTIFFGILLNLLFVFLAYRKGFLNNTEFYGVFVVLIFALALINNQQYLLSPGFNPVRILPINLLSLIILGFSRNKLKLNNKTKIIIFIIALSLSLQFELLIALSILASLVMCLIMKNYSYNKHKIINFQIKNLKVILYMILTSILLKLISLTLIGEASQIFSSSVTETILHKKALFLFASIYSGLWILGGCFCESQTQDKDDNESKLNLISPFLFIPILLFLYPAKFWGSPNHFNLYLMTNIIPFGILTTNLLCFRINLDFFLIKKYIKDNAILKIFSNFLKYKLKSNEKDITSFDLLLLFLRVIIFLITYFFVLISSALLIWRPNSFSIIQVLNAELKLINIKKQNEVPPKVLARPYNRQLWLRNYCSEKYINISSIKLLSCSISNKELSELDVLVSSKDNYKTYIYLSDNSDILSIKEFPKIKSGSAIGSSKGKLAIAFDKKIKTAFVNNFVKLDNFIKYNKKNGIYDPTINNQFLEESLNNLKIKLFEDISFGSDLDDKALIFDRDLPIQTMQLYLYAYNLYRADNNLDTSNNDALETISKVYKYISRIKLLEDRSAEGFNLKGDLTLGQL